MNRRYGLLPLTSLLAVAIVAAACQTATPPAATAIASGKPCPAGRIDARAPIVCVDDSDLLELRVHPEPIELERGAQAQWFTRTGRGDLSIVFDKREAFEVACRRGSGYCTATAQAATAEGSYKYAVVIVADGKTYKLDPTVTLVGAR